MKDTDREFGHAFADILNIFHSVIVLNDLYLQANTSRAYPDQNFNMIRTV